MNKTATQYLIEEIKSDSLVQAKSTEEWNEVFRIAKEMEREQSEITENTSDGYHTFKELYEFRKVYNAGLFNEWANFDIPQYDVHKSWKHHDGELCFGGGWFIVVAILPNGQISNHYEAKDWELFQVPIYEKAKYEFDGHSGKDVLDRIKALYGGQDE